LHADTFTAWFRSSWGERWTAVKSDATPDEVRAVVEDPDAGGQIFRNALAQSDHYGQARQAYKEAQDRHVEIQRLETTITQLGQLFNEVSVKWPELYIRGPIICFTMTRWRF